jgi:hypothetical protein
MTAQDLAVYAEVSRMAKASEQAAIEAGELATQAIITATRVRVLADQALDRATRQAGQMAQTA